MKEKVILGIEEKMFLRETLTLAAKSMNYDMMSSKRFQNFVSDELDDTLDRKGRASVKSFMKTARDELLISICNLNMEIEADGKKKA